MIECTTILYKKEGRVAVISLNRPEVLNAFTLRMGEELLGALENAESGDGIGAIFLTGEGSAFCAGADIKEFKKRIEKKHWDYSPHEGQAFETSKLCLKMFI